MNTLGTRVLAHTFLRAVHMYMYMITHLGVLKNIIVIQYTPAQCNKELLITSTSQITIEKRINKMCTCMGGCGDVWLWKVRVYMYT